MKLAKNTLFEIVTDSGKVLTYRILGIRMESASVFELNSKSMPEIMELKVIQDMLEDGNAKLVAHDPADSKLLPESELKSVWKNKRDSAWESIKNIIENQEILWDSKARWAAISTQCKKNGKSATNTYLLIRKFWVGGQVKNALLPNYANINKRREKKNTTRVGRKPLIGGITIGEEEEKKFLWGIKAFYEKKSKPSLRSAYRKTIARYFNTGYRLEGGTTIPVLPPTELLPTLRQFCYWYNTNRSGEKSLRAREGKNFNLKLRPIVGNSTSQSFGPGDLYQIDSTVGDIYLVSAINPNTIVGRPILYLVTDVFTRCIAGFNLSLEQPSYIQAALALENACSDKVEFCKQFGIDISEEEWPCKGIPTNLVADRGELKGIQADQIEAGLGICLTNTPPYRADMKGIVERTFQIGNKQLFHTLPGAVTKSQERGDEDPRLSATLNIVELTKLVISWILTHNRKRMEHYPANEQMLQEGIEHIPNAIWQWGLGQNQSLPYKSPNVIKTLLLPQAEAGITPQGIRYKRAYYHSEKGALEGWYLNARAGGGSKVKICYDPRDTSNIFIRHDDNFETCHIKEMSKPFAKRTWAEVEQYFYEKRVEQEKNRSEELQKDANLDAQIEEIVSAAKDKIGRPTSTKTARVKNIRENRKDEAERLREESKPAHPECIEQEPDYIPPPSYTDMLKELQKKRLEENL